MGKIKTFFFDTYALFEIMAGNKNYSPYYDNINIITTKLNLMELHYGILRKKGKEKADKKYDDLIKYAVGISDDVLKRANFMKLTLKKRKLSGIDCIGYMVAQQNNISFLTGDKEFKDLPNVEFVK